ncbi:gluconokinase [Arachidicoccus ginsenosidivorans]|nr:gluconokinase [Arachidicoccus ginsenosidivorans]
MFSSGQFVGSLDFLCKETAFRADYDIFERQKLEKMQGKCIIVMGVSGCGKSTIAKAIVGRTGAVFLEGDDFHSKENIAKMHSGHPLNDQDRAGWLAAIHDKILELTGAGKEVIVSCSALKKSYRDRLRDPRYPILFIYLKGSFSLIHSWMVARKGHFMPAKLLKSQFDTLEEPDATEKDIVTIHLQPNLKKEIHQVFDRLRGRRYI